MGVERLSGGGCGLAGRWMGGEAGGPGAAAGPEEVRAAAALEVQRLGVAAGRPKSVVDASRDRGQGQALIALAGRATRQGTVGVRAPPAACSPRLGAMGGQTEGTVAANRSRDEVGGGGGGRDGEGRHPAPLLSLQ